MHYTQNKNQRLSDSFDLYNKYTFYLLFVRYEGITLLLLRREVLGYDKGGEGNIDTGNIFWRR